MIDKLKHFLLPVAMLLLALPAFAQIGLKPTAPKTYKQTARPEKYTTNHVFSEFFTLPSGVSAYDSNDLALKGITFTYENSNPELVTVENCGYDPSLSSRKNQFRYSLDPFKFGDAVVTIYCHYKPEGYEEEVVTSNTMTFTIADAGDNPLSPRETPSLSGTNGLRDSKVKNVPFNITNVFSCPAGWDKNAIWESIGMTWGVEADNSDIISDITCDAASGKCTLEVQPRSGNYNLTCWVERNGVRVTKVVACEYYAVKAKDDQASVIRDGSAVEIPVLANDSKMNVDYELSVIDQPKYGKVEVVDVTDKNGKVSKGFKYTYDTAKKIENWDADTFRYRLKLDENNGGNGEYADAEVKVVIRDNPAISKIFEFVPAPGQFINSGGSFNDATCLIGQGGSEGNSTVPATDKMISLGTFGGYVIVGFDQPVKNDPRNPYGVDFTIGGNAFKAAAKGYWSEPGAVMVMRDDNGNGLPDDTWYELAGSDYWWSTTRRNVTFTYEDPGYLGRYSVPYTTSDGHTGALTTNMFHSQPYFPQPENYPDVAEKLVDGKYSVTGTWIKGVYDRRTPSYIESYRPFAFGYCDNRATNGDISTPTNPYVADGNGDIRDGFDISWAVDKDGNYLATPLDEIHFVKIYNCVSEICGWLGESSTEVAGFSISRPDPDQTEPGKYYLNYAGITQLQVPVGKTCQFEGFAFENGRPMRDAVAMWSVDDETIGTIDQNGFFTAKKIGHTNIHFQATKLAPEDVFEVEVVKLESLKVDLEGNASSESDSELNCLVGETHWINIEGVTSNGDQLNGTKNNRYIYDSYTWTSTDNTVALVDNYGSFKALKIGDATLTATSNTDPNLSVSIEVHVKPLPEIKQYNNYLVIEDKNLTQEKLEAKTFQIDQIFRVEPKLSSTRSDSKRYDLTIKSIEPEGFDDAFYIEGNQLRNRLTKGDYREYRVTFEGEYDGAKMTATFPILHTTTNNTVQSPTVNIKNIEIDLTEKTGTLDLNEVLQVNGSSELYAMTFRLKPGVAVPEGFTATVSGNILTVELTADNFEMFDNGPTVTVQGQVKRATQRFSAPAADNIEVETSAYKDLVIPIVAKDVTGINDVTVESSSLLTLGALGDYLIYNGAEDGLVEVFSIAGLNIASIQVAPGAMVSLSQLPAGSYVARATATDAAASVKFARR